MPEGLLSGLLIVPILAVLILVHEIGHFVAARSVGVKVEEFGIGIPPRIKGWTRNGVLWSINWIPFGGFVRVLGEDGKNMDQGSMNSKSPLQRLRPRSSARSTKAGAMPTTCRSRAAQRGRRIRLIPSAACCTCRAAIQHLISSRACGPATTFSATRSLCSTRAAAHTKHTTKWSPKIFTTGTSRAAQRCLRLAAAEGC